MSNEYRKYILLGKIAKVLLQSNFYDDVEQINFLSILENDKYDNIPKQKFKEDEVKKAIENCASNQKMKMNCADGYRKGKHTYCIEKLNNSVVRQFIVRYKPDGGEGDYKLFWARYNFAEGYIDFWRGQGENESDEHVEDEEECKKHILYNFVTLVLNCLILN